MEVELRLRGDELPRMPNAPDTLPPLYDWYVLWLDEVLVTKKSPTYKRNGELGTGAVPAGAKVRDREGANSEPDREAEAVNEG